MHHAASGRTGLDLGLEDTFGAAIVDIMLPGLDGLSLVEQLRSAGSSMQILFLSGQKTVVDRLSGFKAGGDDYLVKPFSFDELVAHLLALLRQAGHYFGSYFLEIGEPLPRIPTGKRESGQPSPHFRA